MQNIGPGPRDEKMTKVSKYKSTPPTGLGFSLTRRSIEKWPKYKAGCNKAFHGTKYLLGEFTGQGSPSRKRVISSDKGRLKGDL